MNRFYDRFDAPKRIDFSKANYLSDKDDFSMFFLDRCNRLRLLRTDLSCSEVFVNFQLQLVFKIQQGDEGIE